MAQSKGVAASTTVDGECKLLENGNVLLILSKQERLEGGLLGEIVSDFCGAVVFDPSNADLPDLHGKTVYLCGDLSKASDLNLTPASRVFVVKECSDGIEESKWPSIDAGRVPILVHGVGVYYRHFFDSSFDWFNQIQSEHAFQMLTESTKPGTAHRLGLYLTPVEESEDGDAHFRLLRYSSNFSGPTDNFMPTDWQIVSSLNKEAVSLFDNPDPLNHVLAQIYQNTVAAEAKKKQTKAKIKAHADKTKDMPENGLMAFCTFYDNLDRLRPLTAAESKGPPAPPKSSSRFDWGHKGMSGLTRLHFRLKEEEGEGGADEAERKELVSQFSLTLYPGSIFLMPLSTNRLYTHEIRPGELDAGLLPTRMGYVVRCSSAEAVHSGGKTHLKLKGGRGRLPLEPPTEEGMAELRRLYAEENRTSVPIDYGETKFMFSMNRGDYWRPRVRSVAEEFRWFRLFRQSGLMSGREMCSQSGCSSVMESVNLFESLSSSVSFEDVTKGRQGTVLVRTDREKQKEKEEENAHATAGSESSLPPLLRVPIVRTTTKYSVPATVFSSLHENLADEIIREASCLFDSETVPRDSSLKFSTVILDNALIEIYSNAYSTMGFHSDQALDLLEGSHIALFSCYKFPHLATPPQKLVIESKEEGGGTYEIPLVHNSVVLFSVETNRKFRHKIVLDTSCSPPENLWLGVTFRTSNTFVNFDFREGGGGKAVFEGGDGALLELAVGEQVKQFYSMRKRENEEVGFQYPPIAYTISESDMMPPVEVEKN
uniref:Fe2OG dioxygenase domain-containing protein n=1 Tax=Chromera velia CCMP2878 TaxID=1169474 RepID=A0A0G4I9I8_9ALVE|eukprot:Cvel_12286.t1-p1 / transcript=Cvel_12286.t1 / gene=Cvel_12286 / organism=Chromera_velia_CCMP2878 / gene_product=hypothetical protein / transcript_product=hypothetical protein / location=Cvel_scaffold797:37476-39776(+) / protein_length=767 / sequence_SO=supercontig / SO=protein_coding / is_pseudo=false